MDCHNCEAIAVYNPHNRPTEELPVIYGFNNGGYFGWYEAVAISEDGYCLGSHVCSTDAYIPYDLGLLEGIRPDRHEGQYRPHFPDGYRMEYVSKENIKAHEGLMKAIAIATERYKETSPGGDGLAKVEIECSETEDDSSI